MCLATLANMGQATYVIATLEHQRSGVLGASDMADIIDLSTVIASALSEVSVNGTLDVEMDGENKVVAIGKHSGEDVEVVVTVTPARHEAA